ncbi:DinB family protein [Catellatospora sp. KI3]|uniref:DinB family protein n=1 Tax=Catellatospora sp. KI3 TaxID=3041620 RepID=UPI002482CD4A|nr:DinB family protein [Catellatospora sp. KI3]MDI1461534.1 DinB family protein [Catellatospora sp. KI3]
MELADATAMLARTPDTLRTLLSGLPRQWLHRDDGPETWSAYDILGHLRHGDATNWLPRAQMIIEHGTGRAFEPFDRVAMLREAPQPVDELLTAFADARRRSLEQLAARGLTDADLDRPGSHPELGEVRLGQLLAAWVAHDLTHLGQVGEVLARRYRTDVGPWRRYMPALDAVAPAE